jgi:uncharacterized damage-inducible protein DinB
MDGLLKQHFDTFARYNAWANARLFNAATLLSDTDYRADRGAFFRSVHGTLNHLLVTDRVWMFRFTGEGDAPDRLDAILFEQLELLHRAREVEDARIVRYVTGLEVASINAGSNHATSRARAGALVQSPDASSRSGACIADRSGWTCA